MPTPLNLIRSALLPLALGLAACSAEQVTQTGQPSAVAFAKYKTYNFLDEVARNDSAFQRSGAGIFDLKRAVAHEMEARGYQRAANPDLWVNIGIVTKEKTQTRETNFREDAPRYIGQRNYHWQSQDVAVGQYEEGTATVDVVDAARKEQVWQGTTTRVLSRTPSKSARQIDDAVADLFKRYPVAPR